MNIFSVLDIFKAPILPVTATLKSFVGDKEEKKKKKKKITKKEGREKQAQE